MQLVSNEAYLQRMQDALRSYILPELQTSAAQAVGGVLDTILVELLKREQRAVPLLRASVAEGEALAAAIRSQLRKPGGEAQGPTDTLDAERLRQRHAALTREIAALCEALYTARGGDAPATDTAIPALLRRATEWELSFYRAEREPIVDNAPPPTDTNNGRIDRETIETFLRGRHADGDAVSVVAFDSIPGGYGKQTSRVGLREASGAERELIVRKSDRNPMVLHGTFLIENEYALVKAVSSTGYPAPKPLWLGTNLPGVDASFYVMEKLPGRVPGSFLGGPESGISEALLLDMAAQLARLHAIPLDRFAGYIREHDDPALLSGSITDCYRRSVEAWATYAAKIEHLPSPFASFMRDWLLRNLPQDSRRPVLVHGDFNVHNLLVADDRVTGVLDWECAMFGAPEQDLAYIQPHISRHIAWDKFLARYLEAGGQQIDSTRLGFYQAYSMMRLHIGMNHGLLNFQTGANRDIRYAMIELAFGPQIMEMGLACAPVA